MAPRHPGALKPVILAADRRYGSAFVPLRVFEGRRGLWDQNLQRFTTPWVVIASAQGFTRSFESRGWARKS
jgi:hypothetical protein